jgi:hypothetical protein
MHHFDLMIPNYGMRSDEDINTFSLLQVSYSLNRFLYLTSTLLLYSFPIGIVLN